MSVLPHHGQAPRGVPCRDGDRATVLDQVHVLDEPGGQAHPLMEQAEDPAVVEDPRAEEFYIRVLPGTARRSAFHALVYAHGRPGVRVYAGRGREIPSASR
jgi:hypothetical protein